MPRGLYLIWSLVHKAWYLPTGWDGQYTRKLDDAGRYSTSESHTILDQANGAGVQAVRIPVDCTAHTNLKLILPHVKRHEVHYLIRRAVMNDDVLCAVLKDKKDQLSLQIVGAPEHRFADVIDQLAKAYREFAEAPAETPVDPET